MTIKPIAVLTQSRVTIRWPTSTMQVLITTVALAMVLITPNTGQHIATTTNENNSELVATSRGILPISSATQIFAGVRLPWMFGGQQQQAIDNAAVVPGESEGFMSRTFGINRLKKKIAIGMIPVMFKVGIMVMVIFTILLLSIKGVFIGTLLLIINLGFILAKILVWKKQGHSEHGGYIDHSAWSPAFGAASKQNNDIHVHIHNPAPPEQHSHNDLPYSGYAQQNRGPSIHIEPASYSAGGGSDAWPGYQRRHTQSQQYGADYVDTHSGNGNYQANPQYVPNNSQWS